MSARKPAKPKSFAAARPSAPAVSSGSPMDVQLLEEIVRLMSDNDLSTVDLRDGERRVVLQRGAPVIQYAGNPVAMSGAPAVSGAPAAQPLSAAGGGALTSVSESADANLVPIKSPMVGTFYAAPKQGEKAYVSVGSHVHEESEVCIIEAMKVFNVIKAETSGTIARVMIQDGQPVEYGTVLFLVKP